MPSFTFKSYNIHYTDAGNPNGPVILFLHGWMSSSDIFYSQFPHFAPRYRLVAMDFLGHGKSDRPPPAEAGSLYSHTAYQDSVIALIDHLRLENVAILGWSMGCAVTLQVARRIPEKIRCIICVGTTPLLVLPTNEITFPAMPASARLATVHQLTTNFPHFNKEMVYGSFPEYDPSSAEPMPEYVRVSLEANEAIGGEIAAAVLNSVGTEDFRDRMAGVKSRLLMVHGGRDQATLPEAAKWVFEHVGSQEKEMIVYDDAGHSPFLGKWTERFNADVEKFLSGS
jgi:pimeloyl-ACP methyl ester carboxylesterase